MTALLLRILGIIVLGYLVFVVTIFLLQDRMLYFPTAVMNGTPADIGLPFREITFKAADDVELFGWWVGEPPSKEKGKQRDVVLFCHGNGGNISHRLDSLIIFNKLGLDIFIFDYRGYGKSEGKPSEEGTYRDVEAAWKYLVERERVQPARIILFGRSLGGAVAAPLAVKVKAKALILESTFTSVPDLGAQVYPLLPVRLLARFKYDTRLCLREIAETRPMPVLIIHSREDEMIPFQHGEKLFEAAGEPKKFLLISGSHNAGFINSAKVYVEGLREFFSSLSP